MDSMNWMRSCRLREMNVIERMDEISQQTFKLLQEISSCKLDYYELDATDEEAFDMYSKLAISDITQIGIMLRILKNLKSKSDQ